MLYQFLNTDTKYDQVTAVTFSQVRQFKGKQDSFPYPLYEGKTESTAT